MAPVAPPYLERLSSDGASRPDPITDALVESPACEVQPADALMVKTRSSDAGLPFHDHYVRDLEEYRMIFNSRMKNKPVKHDRVHVLMWTWADALDDLKVKSEVSIYAV
jgi:hypothetical protein